MAEEVKRKRGRPPKPKVDTAAKTNSQEKDPKETYLETNSYTAQSLSNFYLGFDIFDLYSPEVISDMIKSPMAHNQALRKLSQQLYSSCGLYSQAVDYCVSMPTLDYCVIPKGKTKSKRNKNKKIMESALQVMHHKEVMRDALFKSMVDGIAFYYCEFSTPVSTRKKTMSDYEADQIFEINDAGVNMAVIPLPTNHTKIVGRKNSSYVLAFNLRYFEGLDQSEQKRKLMLYPKEIRDGWEKYHNLKTGGDNWLILDNTKTIVSKVRSKMEEPWGRPMCLAAIKDILYSFYFQDTCRGQLDELNNRIIYMTFPQTKDGKPMLTDAKQKEMHNTVKTAIINKNSRNATSFFSVAPTTKIDKIDPDTSLFDEKNSSYIQDQIGIDLGFMANLLSGSGSGNYSSQQNNLQLLLSQILSWIEPIAVEFVKVINLNLVKDKSNPIDLYYLPSSYFTRKDFSNQMKELYTQGKGSLRAWISSCGINSEAYLALMESELEENFDEKFKPHPTSYTMSGSNTDGQAGRPETDTPADKTITSRENGGNTLPSPSDT